MRRSALAALLLAALVAGTLAFERRDAPARPRVPVTLAAGTFDGLAHPTTGTATLVALPDGRRKLRFEGFATRAAPDLAVYLVAGKHQGGEIEGGTRIDLLRGFSGKQEYVVPSDAPRGGHVSVVIWCELCRSPFGAAELAPSSE